MRKTALKALINMVFKLIFRGVKMQEISYGISPL